MAPSVVAIGTYTARRPAAALEDQRTGDPHRDLSEADEVLDVAPRLFPGHGRSREVDELAPPRGPAQSSSRARTASAP